MIELVYIDWLIDFSTSVGVFFCGPGVLSMTLHKMCNKHSTVGGTKFFYNKENFWSTSLVYKISTMIIDILFLYLLMHQRHYNQFNDIYAYVLFSYFTWREWMYFNCVYEIYSDLWVVLYKWCATSSKIMSYIFGWGFFLKYIKILYEHAIYWYVYVDFYLLYDTSISALLLQTK